MSHSFNVIQKDMATENTTIQTTLFDLLAAIQDVVPPGQDELVTAIAVYLLRTGRVAYHGDPQEIAACLAVLEGEKIPG